MTPNQNELPRLFEIELEMARAAIAAHENVAQIEDRVGSELVDAKLAGTQAPHTKIDQIAKVRSDAAIARAAVAAARRRRVDHILGAFEQQIKTQRDSAAAMDAEALELEARLTEALKPLSALAEVDYDLAVRAAQPIGDRFCLVEPRHIANPGEYGLDPAIGGYAQPKHRRLRLEAQRLGREATAREGVTNRITDSGAYKAVNVEQLYEHCSAEPGEIRPSLTDVYDWVQLVEASAAAEGLGVTESYETRTASYSLKWRDGKIDRKESFFGISGQFFSGVDIAGTRVFAGTRAFA
jgi:hypothetical protein